MMSDQKIKDTMPSAASGLGVPPGLAAFVAQSVKGARPDIPKNDAHARKCCGRPKLTAPLDWDGDHDHALRGCLSGSC